jgi:hypothetical protein
MPLVNWQTLASRGAHHSKCRIFKYGSQVVQSALYRCLDRDRDVETCATLTATERRIAFRAGWSRSPAEPLFDLSFGPNLNLF